MIDVLYLLAIPALVTAMGAALVWHNNRTAKRAYQTVGPVPPIVRRNTKK
ncbi:hypothetical protein [Rhodopseudomonas palustris]|nr:hypothetical protein [Rhodopseudomonas palustris]